MSIVLAPDSVPGIFSFVGGCKGVEDGSDDEDEPRYGCGDLVGVDLVLRVGDFSTTLERIYFQDDFVSYIIPFDVYKLFPAIRQGTHKSEFRARPDPRCCFPQASRRKIFCFPILMKLVIA